MLTEVKRHLKLMFVSLKYNLSKEMTNRGSFIMQILFMIINNSTFIVQWLILFAIKDNIGGYGLNDVLILWGLAASTYGVSHIFFYNVYAIPDLITNGKLDVFLTQPKNVLFNVSVSSTSPSAIGDLLYGYIIVLIVRFDLYTLLTFTLFTILGGIILTAFSAIVGSFTFWLKKGDLLAGHIQNIAISTATYPEGIFKNVVKVLLYTIVPVGFMVYLPMEIITRFNLVMLVTMILITILFVLLAFLIFGIGLKKYSSSSLMSARI